jgi:DNA uptake protein ComE-like DNA-binding protein
MSETGKGNAGKPAVVDRLTWTLPQRRALLVLLSVLCLGLGVRYACNPAYVSNPQPDRPSRADELADRVDPNTADVNTLIAIPQMGEKRARAIIEFREKRRALLPGQPAFRTASDLTAVRGIGWSMVENLRPYLTFPDDRAATRP